MTWQLLLVLFPRVYAIAGVCWKSGFISSTLREGLTFEAFEVDNSLKLTAYIRMQLSSTSFHARL